MLSTISCLRLTLVGVLLALSGCGFIIPQMRDTKESSSSASYDLLAAEATKIGWTTERSETAKNKGLHFWMLKVTTTPTGHIYLTKNNASSNISFSCDGAVRKHKLCVEAANKLFKPVFGVEYTD